MKKFSIIIIFVALFLSLAFVYIFYNSWLNQTDYWGLAPDGEYAVFVDTDYCVNYKTHKVWLPISESSGGDLHGEWTFTDNTTFYPYDGGCGYYGVLLQGNIIRIAWPINATKWYRSK